ncbi:General secretion pathway protein A [Saliniradius amylolyticus]|uniref:General secretion pathway protein A n=1 Tax=Saliniradius amylolyticus TaxID=2183582 RepID=A0A2S2DZF7_9ALTE|nr:AAA family ATPase [Saliniradius amylolyticus]AWL10784.1 General secretion pathway protein A [Saliniradius amylolyticus]
MYLYHFGLNELPFTLTPNTSYYFGLPSHKQALETLLTALKTGEGFIKVTGEVGTGKTLICRKLLNELPDYFVTAYIPNPYLNPQELRLAVARELEVEVGDAVDQQAFSRSIEQRLIDIQRQGQTVALLIDEAQALPTESIEALRLFSNLETESRKLLQVVLFAQPELDQKLQQRELRQLKQRITFSYQLDSMDPDQLYQYVAHRMKIAGHKGSPVFNRRCCKMLYQATDGTPRIVNVLCHKALMLAYGEGVNQVNKDHIRAAIKDTEAAQQPPQRWPMYCAVSVVALLAVGWWYWQGGVVL